MYRFISSCMLLATLTLAPCAAWADQSVGSSGQTQSPSRLPPPSEKEISASRKLIREVYPSDLAHQTVSERRLLAEKMLDAALETRDNPTDRYVMLQEAMNLAADAGDAEIINKSADALQAGYLCDADAQRADALARCNAVSPSPALAGQVATAEIAAADQAASNDDFNAATKFEEKALAAARTLGDRTFLTAVQSHIAAIRQARAQFMQMSSAFARLKSDPNDPASNLAVGKYLCFTKRQWSAGLPRLAGSSDPALKQLSQSEIAAAADPSAETDLAERWWNVAEQNPELPQEAIKAHAANLYRQALPALSGLAKAVAQKRIDDAARHEAPGVAMLQPPIIETKPKPPPSRELLSELIGGTRQNNGTLKITRESRASTTEKFKPPVAFHIIAWTDSTNIRISYAARQIIFDWELNPDELRVDGGPANGRHKKGAGFIEPATWADIELVVLPDSMTISVNGQQRYQVNADFSDVNQSFGIFTMGNAVVQVKSVTVRPP